MSAGHGGGNCGHSRHWSLLLEVGRHGGFGGHGCGRLCGSGMIWGGK